jgi:hypothetical protein
MLQPVDEGQRSQSWSSFQERLITTGVKVGVGGGGGGLGDGGRGLGGNAGDVGLSDADL